MSRKNVVSHWPAAVCIALLLVTASTSHAGWWNATMRSLGLGWSDGYHSRNGCPTCVGPCQCGSSGAVITHGAEPLPAPARTTPVAPSSYNRSAAPRTAVRPGQLPSTYASPYENLR
ncbi:hypothetical protein Psta_0352 [Pirellula staleyi DSM 6068]|uniref:Uncharacterized protein n=1 Tax=Pirellula staleyi (strain ATCC 27377 / DSM 6068 / ICPB 4128) TaxID=530564 RepID=D2R2D3_PIRSD|nr:hypothetical protein [Pirellula staleyi]ADB15042.1 hypothetical protein Psta_0352 [Pirellula staleyi DSM 6068]